MYIHERKEWPEFRWNQSALTGRLAEVRHAQGRLLGRMETLGFMPAKTRISSQGGYVFPLRKM